jgi:hypothetical protein
LKPSIANRIFFTIAVLAVYFLVTSVYDLSYSLTAAQMTPMQLLNNNPSYLLSTRFYLVRSIATWGLGLILFATWFNPLVALVKRVIEEIKHESVQ